MMFLQYRFFDKWKLKVELVSRKKYWKVWEEKIGITFWTVQSWFSKEEGRYQFDFCNYEWGMGGSLMTSGRGENSAKYKLKVIKYRKLVRIAK